jgi:hypothetical protein
VTTITRLVENSALDGEHYAAARFHRIGAAAQLAKYNALGKLPRGAWPRVSG